MELTRKKEGRHVFGLTLPLILNSDGSKFGKTAAGAVWVDSKKTSVYRFYQFWIRSDDSDVLRHLNFFTFLGKEEIQALAEQHKTRPESRAAHKVLAAAMTDLVHGKTATSEAVRASEILFGGELEGIAESTFNEIVGEVPTREMDRSRLEGAGTPLVEVLATSGLSPSKGQARKDIEGGGVYVNNIRQSNLQRAVTTNDLLFGKHLLLRKGKRNYTVISIK
jgi:tyrosyl-tRNA synthetase